MIRDRQHSLLQNVAAISGDFHAHRDYWAFCETFGKHVDGFVGQYHLCIEMAKALTDWENANGGPYLAYENHDLLWIDVIERYVAVMIGRAVETGEIPNAGYMLRRVLMKETPS
jgi:hypothetical protein